MAVTISGSGQVPVQVVQFWTDATTQYTGTNNFTTIGVSASITPTSASSKILVEYSVTLGVQENLPVLIRLLRNGSAVGANTNASGSRNLGNSIIANGGSYSNQHLVGTGSMSFLDSPNTTSAVTYALQVRTRNDSSYRVRLNASDELNDAPYQLLGTSTITLFEIAG